MAERLTEPLPVSPAAATPRVDFDDTLGRAIDAGRLDPALAADDANLIGAFAAHQKLESLFAALRGDPCRERGALCAPCRSADAVWRSVDEPAPTRLGRYQVRSTLGMGAFGTVYLAHDPELNRDVAVKVSRAGAFASAGVFDKFRAEARHAASLNHPNIVTIYDVGREGEQVYIVMQYIAGQTLADAITSGPLAPDRAAELLATVADALHYAHKLGFVHRDLKPANILLDAHRNPHVADFGLAVSDETQRVLAGQIAGTPAYMSPEQARGASHHLDGRADIWSLGVIGYELLTGRQPFWQGDVPACLDAIAHRDPKPPRQIDDTIPAELERIILKCLAKQPTDRYSTAGDVAADLRRWLRGQSGGGTTARRAIIAAAFIVAACLAVFGWRATRGMPTAATQPLTGAIDVRLWNLDDPARRGLTLGEPGALPLRIGDQVRIEASVSEPSYVYIVWIGADGVAHPVYPWLNGDWRDCGTEKPIATLSLPDDPTLGWRMFGPAGTEMLLMLARRSPFDRSAALAELLRGLPRTSIDNPKALVLIDEGRIAGPSSRAPRLTAAQAIDDSVLVARRFFEEQFGEGFNLYKALCFEVERGSSQ